MADASSTRATSPRDARASSARPRPLPPRTQVLLEWLSGQPLVPPALGLVTGIALDAAQPIPFVALVLLFVATGPVIVRRRGADGPRHAAMFAATLCIGAMLHDAAYRHWPSRCIVRYCGDTPTPARLTGTLLATPLIRPTHTGRIEWFQQSPVTRLLVSADGLEGISGPLPVEGIVSVKVNEPVPVPRPGDRVEVFGRLHRPSPPDSNDSRDWARISRRNGVLVQMTCDHAENVRVLRHGTERRSPSRLLAAVRRKARLAMLDRTWPGDMPGSNLLEALVLGQRSAVDPAINQAFVDTGTVHYLSVSGAHVGMLAGALWWIAIPAGRSRRVTACWIAVVITAYGLVAEANPPIWRSVIMGDVMCAAVILGHPLRVANWLALSAIVLLVLKPTDLFDPGFQLSFSTLISLIYLGPSMGRGMLHASRYIRGVRDPLLTPEIQRLFHPHPIRMVGWKIERATAFCLGVGISAWLAGVALGAYHFYQVSLWGWLNSLILAPLVTVVLVLGLIKTVATSVWVGLGLPFAPLLTWSTDLLIEVVYLLTRLPGSPLPPVHVSGPGVAAFTAVLLLWMLRDWLRLSARTLRMVTLAFVTLAAWRMAPPGPSRELRVEILAVGSGSAHLIRLPGGHTLLYDMGARPPYDIQRWTLGPLLARSNIYRIDALLLSHPDLDHFSGVPDLLSRQWVRRVLTTGLFDLLCLPDSPSGRLLQQLESHGFTPQSIGRGERLSGTGDAHVECLWPPPPDDLPSTLTTNDASMVLRITFGGRRILLTGDIEDYAQRRLIDETDLRADVLVLPHHGAVTTFTRSFIQAVNPTWCIRSSGQHDADTRTGLLDALQHRRYLNTAEHGDITITLTSEGLTVSYSRQPRR